MSNGRYENMYDQLKAKGFEKKEIYAEIAKALKEEQHSEEALNRRHPYLSMGFFERKQTEKGTTLVPAYYEYSKYVREVYHIISNEAFIYKYHKTHYKYCQRLELDKLCIELTKNNAKPLHLNGFNRILLAESFKSDTELQTPAGFVNLKNGILNLHSMTLVDHNPDLYFRYCLDHNYDPKAECPRFIEFLNFVFEDNQQLVDLTAEAFGYTLYGGDPVAHKAFMLYGEGRNGKSTWLYVLNSLLGKDNTASVSMKFLDKPFSMISLDGKLANIVEESPYKIDPESFKNITAGGYVRAAHKGKPEIDLKVNARLFFATNKFPNMGDSSVGNRERILILPFQRFIKDDERNRNINADLSHEMSGILNFAIQGLLRLKARSFKFIQPDASAVVFEDYVKESDSVVNWFCDNISWADSDASFLPTKNLYAAYVQTAKFENFKPVKMIEFAKRIAKEYEVLLFKNLNRPVASRDRKNDSVRGLRYASCSDRNYSELGRF